MKISPCAQMKRFYLESALVSYLRASESRRLECEINRSHVIGGDRVVANASFRSELSCGCAP